jgi:colanic acid/amylovoran biosynthesis glycosyltransferase
MPPPGKSSGDAAEAAPTAARRPPLTVQERTVLWFVEGTRSGHPLYPRPSATIRGSPALLGAPIDDLSGGKGRVRTPASVQGDVNRPPAPMAERAIRIAYVIGTYPLLTTTFIARERAELERLGHATRVTSIRRPPPESLDPEEAAHGGIDYVLPVRARDLAAAHLRFVARRPRAYASLLAFLVTRPHPSLRARVWSVLHFGEGVRAAAMIERFRPDVIHAHFVDRAATIALVAARLLDVPFSVTAHARDIFESPVLLPEKLGQAAFAVTVSDFNRDHLLRVAHVPPERLHVLHPWVDGLGPEPGVRASAERFRIVSVGRLVEKKGHDVLIEACRRVADRGCRIDCEIVGDGPLRAELESRIARLGLAGVVRLAGPRSHAEVEERLVAADLFVLACRVGRDGDRDGMPVAIAEAMAAGVPVVSTRIGGIEELVRDGTGLLVPPDDPDALADAIERLVDAAPEVRERMGRAGRDVVAADFTVGAGVSRLAGLFAAAAGHPA